MRAALITECGNAPEVGHREQRAEAIRVVAGHILADRLTVDHDAADAWSRQAAGRANRRVVLTP